MKLGYALMTGLLGGLLAASGLGQAYEGNWKRGHVYYRMVCTPCHASQAGGAIGPNTRTRAEWQAYLQADRHARGKDSVMHFMSRPYRAGIMASNRAAEKFIDVPEQELREDLKAFVLRSARDGDAPTGCR